MNGKSSTLDAARSGKPPSWECVIVFKTVSLSFVIVFLALLLIAATPSSERRHEGKPKQYAKDKQSSPTPVSMPSYQLSAKPTAAEHDNYTYNYYYPISPPVTKSEGLPVWFQVLTGLVLLAFTGGLWWTSYRQWQAIKKQADIAERTLRGNRPKLVLTEFKLTGLKEPAVNQPNVPTVGC